MTSSNAAKRIMTTVLTGPPKLWGAQRIVLLPAHYHARYEPVPLQAKRDAFYPINYECSGIIDGKNVVGYLPTPEA